MEDDKELEQLGRDYYDGKLLTSVIKGKLIDVITNMVKEHQERRAKVTDEQVRKFMELRPLKF